MTHKLSPRIWEIDFFRGLAVILMIFFHLTYDLRYFFGFENITVQSGFWYYEGRLTATIFMLLVGISTVLMSKIYTQSVFRRKNMKRGLHLLGLGLLITLVTWIYAPGMAIHFGMLHFLGISALLLTFFVEKPFWTLLTIIILLGIGFQMDAIKLQYYALIPLGFPPVGYQSFDYYPLIPLLAVPLFGVILGNIFYREQKSLFGNVDSRLERGISYLGRKSLVIYLVHQPVMLAALYVLIG